MTSDPATPLIDLIQLAAADTDVVLDVDTSLDEMLRIAEITKLSASFAARQVGEVTFGRLRPDAHRLRLRRLGSS